MESVLQFCWRVYQKCRLWVSSSWGYLCTSLNKHLSWRYHDDVWMVCFVRSNFVTSPFLPHGISWLDQLSCSLVGARW